MLSLYLVQSLTKIELQQFVDKSISIIVSIFSSKKRQTLPFQHFKFKELLLCHLWL